MDKSWGASAEQIRSRMVLSNTSLLSAGKKKESSHFEFIKIYFSTDILMQIASQTWLIHNRRAKPSEIN